MAALLYLYPLLLWFVLRLMRRNSAWELTLGLALFYKIAMACLMTWLVINNYGFGDLPTYFVLAKQWALQGHTGEFERGFTLVPWLNSLVFSVLPPSIYGLAVLTGFTSLLYCLWLLKAFATQLNPHWYWVCGLLILFLPVFSTQSGYIGKETWVLPMLGLVFLGLSKGLALNWRLLVVLALMVVIGMMRPYQGLILFLSLSLAMFITSQAKYRLRLFALGLVAAAMGYAVFGDFVLANLATIAEDGLLDFLSDAYAGGNLMLTPYPQPLTTLQNFRPFPWEAHNAMALVASLENAVVLGFFAVLVLHLLGLGRKAQQARSLVFGQFFTTFVVVYSALNLILFSYNPNVGDLARRHIYYYPQLILLAGMLLSQRPLKPKHTAQPMAPALPINTNTL